jgi:hypothetical protein
VRTTLDIADDVLFAAKDFARRDKKTLGQVISEWGRSALLSPVFAQQANDAKTIVTPTLSAEDQRFYELGFKTLPHREGVGAVTNDMVNRIRDEEGI